MRNLYIIPDGLITVMHSLCSFSHGIPIGNGEHLYSVQFSDQHPRRADQAGKHA